MNLRQIKTKTLDAASAVALDAAIAAWRDTLPDATFVSLSFVYEGGTFTCLIVYTE